ncbi:Putative tetracycline-efflux transporter [Corynebacterium glyciniphilum AJ 3170]|uniref:Putative tetracycline-efflux transporter n=2 Tax=Corynebacterium TaxID=1716 RepID=X5E5K2_9CORY|nr:Putative tetracycline-efflux transporter [Corynebacterium glyciniphilum AJ 3170]
MLVAVTLLNVVGMTIVLPILPFVVRDVMPSFGTLALWVGLLEAVNALCAFIAAPILGGISDRWGRRPVIVIGAFGAAVGFLVFALGGFLAGTFSGAIWLLLLGRIIQGVTAGDMPALFAYVADITPANQRAKRYGMLGALTGIGFMIGPALGGLLATHSIDLPVLATAGVALTVGVLTLVALPESHVPENRTARLTVEQIHPLNVFREAFARPSLRMLLSGLLLVAIPFSFFVNNYSVLAMDTVNWSPTQIGLLNSCIGVLDIVIQGVLLGILLKWVGERGVILGGLVVQATGVLLLALLASAFNDPWLLIMGTLMLGAGEGPMTATLNGVLSTSVSDDEQGWLAGVTQGMQNAVGVVVPLAVGVLYGIGIAVPYWIALVLLCAAFVVLSRAAFDSPSRGRRAPERPGAATEPEPSLHRG